VVLHPQHLALVNGSGQIAEDTQDEEDSILSLKNLISLLP
jgi:hypothetical protein